MITVSILGPSADLPRCESVRDRLREHGVKIGFDWPSAIRALRILHASETPVLGLEERRITARYDLCGVRESDYALWLTSPSVGAAYEAGYADAFNIPIVVSGPSPHELYGYSPAVQALFTNDDAAIAWLALRNEASR